MRALLASALVAAVPFVASAPRQEAPVTLPPFVYTPLGDLKVTSYRSVPEQTDDSPFITSIGYRTNRLGVAVSQEMLCKVSKWCRRNVRLFCDMSAIHYGDTFYVEEVGFRIVFDAMHPRHKRAADVWVASPAEEKRFHKRFGKRRLNVWLIRGEGGEGDRW